MIRHGRWKYIYHVGFRPELYDLEADPGETTDLAEQPEMASVLAECHAALLRICDPEAVSAEAFADQRRRIALNGGRDAVMERGDYGYTPAPGEKPARIVSEAAAAGRWRDGMQQDGITRTAEIAYVVLILAVAGIVWREASTLPPAPYDALGPKAFPIWVSYALAALGLTMLVSAAAGALARPRADNRWWWVSTTWRASTSGDPGRPSSRWSSRSPMRARLSFRSVGFLPATAVYLFLSGAVLGPLKRRRLTVLAVFAVAAAVVLDLLFRRIFKLDLT